MSPTVLKADMLNQQVYNLLKEEILRQHIAPGERLVDSQLAEQLGVSRTPVRDAIFMLAREGLVENKGKRGFYVLEADAKDIDELYGFRAVIETYAAAEIISRMSEGEDLGPWLRSVRDESARLLAEGDSIAADECFHDALVSILDNRRVSRAYEEMKNQTRVFRKIKSESDEWVQNGNWYHEQILEALMLQNGPRADRLIRDHIENGRREARADAGV
ncbi:MAG: GntR family transcriptional regulator [Christensenellaceae bacterium]|nr:GntR family transcriptional regulator [Christensenellaceae bacterium]